jgi:hypothetical protein
MSNPFAHRNPEEEDTTTVQLPLDVTLRLLELATRQPVEDPEDREAVTVTRWMIDQTLNGDTP